MDKLKSYDEFLNEKFLGLINDDDDVVRKLIRYLDKNFIEFDKRWDNDILFRIIIDKHLNLEEDPFGEDAKGKEYVFRIQKKHIRHRNKILKGFDKITKKIDKDVYVNYDYDVSLNGLKLDCSKILAYSLWNKITNQIENNAKRIENERKRQRKIREEEHEMERRRREEEIHKAKRKNIDDYKKELKGKI